jgi:hypothetical protein
MLELSWGTRALRVSAVVVAGLLIQGCGGGGGDGEGGVVTPPVETSSLEIRVAGLDGGTLKLSDGLGNARQLDEAGSVFFPAPAAGAPYTVSITGQPANQFCEVAAGSGLFETGTVVAVDCIDGLRFIDEGSRFGTYRVVGVDVLQPFSDTPGAVTVTGDAAADFVWRKIGSQLLLTVPENARGDYSLSVVAGGRPYSRAFTVVETRLPDDVTPQAYLSTRLDQAVLDIDEALADGSDFESDAGLREVRQALLDARNDLGTMTAAQARSDALFTHANFSANDPKSVLKAQQLIRAKAYEANCSRSAATFTAVVILGVSAVAIASGATVTVVGGMIALAAAAVAIKKVRAATRAVMDDCVVPVYESALQMIEQSTASSQDHTVQAKALAAPPVRLLFTHEQLKQYEVGQRVRLDSALGDGALLAARSLAQLHAAVNAVLPAALALPGGEWVEQLAGMVREFLQPVAPADLRLGTISDARIDGVIAAVSDAVVELRFSFKDGQAPSDPVDFSFTLIQSAMQDDDAEHVLSARLSPPLAPTAFADRIEVLEDGGWRGLLRAENAERFELVEGVTQGVLTLVDGERGEFLYVPTAGYVGDDGFTFVARNARGVSVPQRLQIGVVPACQLQRSGASDVYRYCQGWVDGNFVQQLPATKPEHYPMTDDVLWGAEQRRYHSSAEWISYAADESLLVQSTRTTHDPASHSFVKSHASATYDVVSGQHLVRTEVKRSREVYDLDPGSNTLQLTSGEHAYFWLESDGVGAGWVVSVPTIRTITRTGHDAASAPLYRVDVHSCSGVGTESETVGHMIWTSSAGVTQEGWPVPGRCPRSTLSSLNDIAPAVPPDALSFDWRASLATP